MLSGRLHAISIRVDSCNLHSSLYHISGPDLISALKYVDVRFLRLAQCVSVEVGLSTKKIQVRILCCGVKSLSKFFHSTLLQFTELYK